MKHLFTLAFFTLALFTSCQNIQDTFSGNSTDEKDESSKKKKVSKRDYSITKAVAFNDIFIDSMDLENFITKNTIADSVARRLRSFYNTRNYEFAWFNSDGLTEQALGFWCLQNYSGDTAHKSPGLQKKMSALMLDEDLKVSESNKSLINTELQLTNALIHYTRTSYEKGYVKRKEMERFIPFKKQRPIYLADSLLNKKHNDDKYFSDVNTSYRLLKDQLDKYVTIANKGGWPTIEKDAKLYKNGKSSESIRDMKKMLFLTGDIPILDTTLNFNDTLKSGIENFERRYGYTADGSVTADLLKEMNVSAIDRVKQLLINMNRMRWMPQQPEGKLILVNIPEFKLHVYEGDNQVLEMPVVVGKEGHNTTIFSDKLTNVVFSPYWNVPESIVKKEILPELQKNPLYLESKNMEVIGGTDELPDIRQKPGGDNSLGLVKFLFPNSFNIYFHDTPAKSLFSKDVRAYSHGCIRLGDPQRLAEYLLKDNSKWDSQAIYEAMHSGEEKYVKVSDPVPVFITYYTAWVDENGILNFRNDIYGHDQEIANKMFDNSAEPSPQTLGMK